MSEVRPDWRPRRPRALAVPALLAALALPACIDLVPVYPPDESTAVLDVFLRARSPAGPSAPAPPVVLTAVLDPGIADGGRRRTVTDPTLVVAGVELQPTERGPLRLVFSASITIDRETLGSGSFTVVPPVVAGLEAADIAVQWPQTSRTGPASDTVPAGSVVRLGLATADRPDAPTPAGQRWSATVFGGTRWYSQGGEGPPPPEIEIVTDEFAGPGGQILAIANISRTVEVAGAGGRQLTRVDLTEEVEWSIVIGE